MSSLFINTRDAALRLLFGGTDVLNGQPYHGKPLAATELAAAIKRSINQFKADAMDERGERVNYRMLRWSAAYTDYRTTLTPQLHMLDLGALRTRNERIAFWVNLYNALVIDAVIAYDVTTSVTDGFIGALTFFRTAAYTVGGHRFCCEDIEHGILRSNQGNPFIPGAHFDSTDPRTAWIISPMDARIHFALNCASRSCPPIGVYDPEMLDAQLDLAARNFIDADVQIDEQRRELCLSQIFRWYLTDFGGYPGLISMLQRYLPDDDRRAWLSRQHSVDIAFRAYDWSLPLAP